MAKRAAAKVTARQEKKENVAGGDAKALAWTFIVYPESAPKNWKEVLDGYHIPWVSSPLHDKDINATGEPKNHTGIFSCLLRERRLTGKF